MKDLKIINTVALLIPAIISFLSVFENDLLILALISTSATGFLQVATSLILLSRKPKNIYNGFYLLLLTSFFISLNFTDSTEYFYTIATILCIYFSLLIYVQESK